MAPKYRPEVSEFIHSLFSRENIGTKKSLFKIGTQKVDDYYIADPQVNQSSYFISDHTHYCLNCKGWYPSKESVFDCKLQHATVTHTEHVTYCA
jgi:hypothetical protein